MLHYSFTKQKSTGLQISRWRSPTASTSQKPRAAVRQRPRYSSWSPGWRCWRERSPCSEPSVGPGAAARARPWVSTRQQHRSQQERALAARKNIQGLKKGFTPKCIQADRSRILMVRVSSCCLWQRCSYYSGVVASVRSGDWDGQL